MNMMSHTYTRSTIKAMYSVLLVLLIINALLPLSVSATEMSPPFIPPSDPYINQVDSHYYTVTFDGEGEALVSLKLTLYDKNISALSFTIPEKDVRILNVIQEVETVEKTCQPSYYPVYDYAETTRKCEQYSENLKCTEWDANLTCVKYEKECIKYVEQCSYYSDSYSYSYYSADHTVVKGDGGSSSVVSVTLPQPLTADTTQKLVLLVSYKVNEAASKSWGVFKYDFSTIEIDRDTNYVRVATSVIDPFILKGGTATVDYRPSPTLDVFGSAPVAKLEASTDYRYGEASRYIEYAYGFVEETQALDPLETFTVKGSYAESRIALYKGRIIAIGLVILAVLIGFIFGVRAIIKSLGNAATQHRKQGSRTASLRAAPAHTARKVPTSQTPQDLAHTVLVVGAASFLSAILVFATWYLAKFVMSNLFGFFGYSYNYSLLQSFISMALFLVATILILLEMAVPPFWVAFKKGWLPGVFTFVATLVWLVLIIIVVITLYVATSGGYSGGYY